MEALTAFGGIALGWVLGAGTQIWRDRRQARIALTLVHNELLGIIAQLDLAMRTGANAKPLRTSHWYKRWKLSRTAWEQQGAVAMLDLDGDEAWEIHNAYHALDAAELLFEETREAVIALGEAVGNLGDPKIASSNPQEAATFARLDAEAREKLGIQIRRAASGACGNRPSSRT
jgi:hypothetical protein